MEKIIDERMIQDIIPDKRYQVWEVKKILNVSKTTVYEHINSGALRSINVSAKTRASYRVPGWAIIDFIKARCTEE